MVSIADEVGMSEELFTWNEWEKLGYRVVKGEKSCGRNEFGIAVFSSSQVTEYSQMSPEEAELYGFDEQHF